MMTATRNTTKQDAAEQLGTLSALAAQDLETTEHDLAGAVESAELALRWGMDMVRMGTAPERVLEILPKLDAVREALNAWHRADERAQAVKAAREIVGL